MPLLVECPVCKKRLAAAAKVCESKTGRGCGSQIPQKGRVYWVQFRADGKTKQKRIGPRKKAAENYLRKIETEVCEERFIDKKDIPKITIKEFVDEVYRPWCKSHNRGYQTKKYHLAAIVKRWGALRLDELTVEDVERFRWQMDKAKTRVKYNRVLATLSHLYTIAVEFEKVEKSPVTPALMKGRFREQGRLRYLLPDDVERLVGACQGIVRDIVIVALHTGMRKSELLHLKLGENVRLEEERFVLTITKNGQKRYVPMSATAKEVVSRLAVKKKPGEYIFTRKNGEPCRDIRKAFSAALSAAKIDDFVFHDLRHTAASNLVMAGVDLFTVKEILGHRDIKQTQKYAHLAPEHRAQAVRKFDEVYGRLNPIQGPITGSRQGSRIGDIGTAKEAASLG